MSTSTPTTTKLQAFVVHDSCALRESELAQTERALTVAVNDCTTKPFSPDVREEKLFMFGLGRGAL